MMGRKKRTPEKYWFYIFDTPNNFDKYSMLEREAQLISSYTVVKLDINSTEAFYKKIAYHCQSGGGLCALVDVNGGLIVRLPPPTSFFHLREMLMSLGYRTCAQDIRWITEAAT